MRSHTASIALSISLCLALVGCTTPRVPPPSAVVPDVAEVTEQRVAQVWERTGLEGTVERPDVQPSANRSFAALSACIDDAGITEWMMTDGPDGPGFQTTGAANTAEVQLAMYECFARHPTETLGRGVSLTTEQLDYLYDYYRSWVIPCLALDEITVLGAPTRDEFHTPLYEGWSPYAATTSIRTKKEYKAAVAQCGSPYADLDLDGIDLGSDLTTYSVIG